MNKKWKVLRVLVLHELEHIRKSYFLHLCTFNKTELILDTFRMRFPTQRPFRNH